MKPHGADERELHPNPHPDLHLRLNGVREAVEPARLAVLKFLEPAALPARVVYRIELVLEELLLNVALHGGPAPAEGHIVDLTVSLEEERVLVCMSAEGLPFDPRPAAAGVPAPSLENATPGGLGLMLVRRATVALDYERRDDRNVLRLAFDRERNAHQD
jgi:anti-sigma regulatory factor (Ser/Thr protein kinase)